jgi:hypothetical protein
LRFFPAYSALAKLDCFMPASPPTEVPGAIVACPDKSAAP